MLVNLDHRGARGAEEDTGDGAGILVQLPHAFFLRECSELGISLPGPGDYAVGPVLPAARPAHPRRGPLPLRARARRAGPGASWAGARCPPTTRTLGATAISGEPAIQQVIVAPPGRLPHAGRVRAAPLRGPQVRHAHGARVGQGRRGSSTSARCPRGRSSTRACSRRARCRPTSRTSRDEAFESALALVHSRFSTNTLPTWPLAHPFRTLAHNGEINTLRGNVNWMQLARGPHRVGALQPPTRSRRCGPSPRRAAPTRASSTTSSSSSCWAAAACPT